MTVTRGAERRRLARQREAHPARGAVADEAHGVDRLARAAGGDEHPQADEVGRGRERRRPRRAPRSPPAARRARAGARRPASPLDASRPLPGSSTTAPRPRSVATFACVAGCSHMWLFIAGATSSGQRRGERGARQQVVGEAGGELGDGVRRGRRDDEDVRVADELEVAERVVVGRADRRGRRRARGRARTRREDRRAGQRGERRGPDEALRGGRLDDPYGVACGGRQAHELERLVGGDPAADAEQDPGHGALGSERPSGTGT